MSGIRGSEEPESEDHELKKKKSSKDRTWSAVPNALLEVIAEEVE